MKDATRTHHNPFQTSNKILIKWIISGCFILIIPMACIIINYLYTKDLLEKKVNESNKATLNSTRYNIDSQLQSILNISHYIILNPAFSNSALNTTTQSDFLTKVESCQQYLKNYKQVNQNLDIMVYFPNREFILTPEMANSTYYTFNTILSRKSYLPEITYEEWTSLINTPKMNQFIIDPKLSYQYFGEDSIIFSVDSPFIYQEKNKFNVFTSIPCTFISDLVPDNNSTICILDSNGKIIKQFGSVLDVEPNDAPIINIKSDYDITNYKLNDETYVCSYAKSAVTKWYYAVCTPNSIYLKEAIKLRNVSLLTILLTMLFSFSSIIILQIRNYRPIGKLVDILPSELKKMNRNEFELIEKYYNSLNDENRKMKTTLESRANYAKEVFLLSKLKGRVFHLSESDVGEYLEWEQNNKAFAIASFYFDSYKDNRNVMHFDLIDFSIENVMNEMFGTSYSFEKVIDEIFLVYIFSFDDTNEASTVWNQDCMEKFKQVYEFFRDQFKINLSITVGNVFENFETASDNYNEILDAFEYRYVVEQYGVLSTQSLESIDFSLAERLQYYRKELNICLTKKKLDRAKELVEKLFQELHDTGDPFSMVKYYILSIMSELLVTFRNTIDGNMINNIMVTGKSPSKSLETHLQQLSASSTLEQIYNEFMKVLKLLCGEWDPPAESTSTKSVDDNFIVKIRTYVEEHYKNPDMNISSISDAIGLSPKYLSRLFKDATSEGLLAYINLVRITHAKKLLHETNDTIDEIAEKTGFTNARSFRRNFLKIVGMNPTDFRK